MARKRNVPHDVFKYVDMRHKTQEDCWPWRGALGGREDDRRPYFTLDGKRVLAYRIVFDLFSKDGPLREGELVRHTCDNPVCCNPHHLLRGDSSDNTQDKLDRERHGGLPMAVVERIKLLYATGDYTHLELSRMYNVTRSAITDILNGRRRTGTTQKGKVVQLDKTDEICYNDSVDEEGDE